MNARRVDDSSAGWTIQDKKTGILMEKTSDTQEIQNRASLFCFSAVGKIRLECEVREIAPKRGGFMVFLMNEILQKLADWLNGFIKLKKEDVAAISLA